MNLVNIEQKVLECPVCFNIEAGPKYNCQTGHTVCSKCSVILKSCAICNQPITTSRNYTLESLIDSLKIGPSGDGDTVVTKYCPFKSEGCMEHSDSTVFILHDHAPVCDYRTINCALDYNSDCYRKDFNYSDFFNHLKHGHQIHGIDDYCGPFAKIDFCDKINEDIKWKPFYIRYDGNVFFRRCQLLDGIIYWWFTLLGSQTKADNYLACIQSPCDPAGCKTVPSFKFCIPVLSFRMPTKHVLTSGKYASMTIYQLQSYCKTNMKVESDPNSHAYIWETRLSVATKPLS